MTLAIICICSIAGILAGGWLESLHTDKNGYADGVHASQQKETRLG
jgi:hypothetical protein